MIGAETTLDVSISGHPSQTVQTITETHTRTETPTVGYKSVTTAGVTFQWMVVDSGTNLDCILTATATGWVAVGFHSNTATASGKGFFANIIIGYVDLTGTSVSVVDNYNDSGNGHGPDTSFTGADDIITYSGTEINGITELRFKIPLNSGDPYDLPLVVGDYYNILLAWDADDDTTKRHDERGVVPNTQL